MITNIEKREEITNLLNQLEISVKSGYDDFFVKDSRCPSLVLWSKYQSYLNGVLSLFELKEKQDYKNLENVITFLELDDFFVNANECADKSNLEMQNYIERIKKKIH